MAGIAKALDMSEATLRRRLAQEGTSFSALVEEVRFELAKRYLSDPTLEVAKSWCMLPAELTGASQGRTAADTQTGRNVFVVGPDKKIKLILVYPMTTGRNVDEVLRVIDSLQVTAKHKVATPVNW